MGAKKLKHNYIKSKLSLVSDYKSEDITEEEFYKYMGILHDGEKGFVSLLKVKNGRTQRWSLNSNELEQLNLFQDEENFYCSVNTLYAPGRHSGKYVNKLNALIIDLDYYNVPELKDLTAMQVVGLLESEKDYPSPSFYIDSGRGLYIIWLLENTYATTASKRYWKQIEKTLIDVFSDYGSDKKVSDVARVLRLIGTKNSKTGNTVKIIQSVNYYDTSQFDNILRYELGDIAEYFWGCRELFTSEKKHKKVKRRKQTQKLIQLKNTYTLNYNRYKDLETIVELRANKKEEGWREYLLFLYRLNLLYCNIEPEIALQMTLALNNKLGIPLGIEEVTEATGNAEGVAKTYHRLKDNYKDSYDISLNQHLYNGGAYIYTNKTIIEELNITEEEQSHLLTIIGVVEKKVRKDKRNKVYYEENKEDILNKMKSNYQDKLKADGKLTRAEQNEIIRGKIKSLLNQGKKQQEIADMLGVNVKTIKRHVKSIKDSKISQKKVS